MPPESDLDKSALANLYIFNDILEGEYLQCQLS